MFYDTTEHLFQHLSLHFMIYIWKKDLRYLNSLYSFPAIRVLLHINRKLSGRVL